MDESSGETSLEQAEITERRRLRWLDRLAWLPSAPFVLVAALSWLMSDLGRFMLGTSMLTAFAMVGLLIPALGALAWYLAPRRLDGDASIDDGELRVGGRRLADAGELAIAWASSRRVIEAFTVDGDEIKLVLEKPETEALVEELRAHTNRERAYALRLESVFGRATRKMLAWFFPITLATIPMWFDWRLAPALLLALPLVYLGARGTKRLRFGADGIEVLGRFRRRFVGYREIARVESSERPVDHRAVSLVLESGERVWIAGWASAKRAELLTALLREGVAMAAEGEAAGAHVPTLGRGDDDEDAWRARLDAASGNADYRGPALDAARLLDLMRNPAADPEQRVAAALALRKAPGGATRIRVAAQVSTDPSVKGALEALAEEEIDERRVRRVLSELAR